jgi:hypothetical protein
MRCCFQPGELETMEVVLNKMLPDGQREMINEGMLTYFDYTVAACVTASLSCVEITIEHYHKRKIQGAPEGT